MDETFTTTQYIDTSTTGSIVSWSTIASTNGPVGSEIKAASGISPQLYFKYIKKKFSVLERMKLEARLKRLEKAFHKVVDNGQEMLGEKLLRELAREARESALYAKGIKYFIDADVLNKHKRNIRGGHISDTKFRDFTRVIPPQVLEKKKKVESLFDGFVIYHYWDKKAEEKRAKAQRLTEEEKGKLRDPILFGVIKESNRLYFVADWEDEFCDLTFEEMVDMIGKDEDEVKIPRDPKFLSRMDREIDETLKDLEIK